MANLNNGARDVASVARCVASWLADGGSPVDHAAATTLLAWNEFEHKALGLTVSANDPSALLMPVMVEWQPVVGGNSTISQTQAHDLAAMRKAGLLPALSGPDGGSAYEPFTTANRALFPYPSTPALLGLLYAHAQADRQRVWTFARPSAHKRLLSVGVTSTQPAIFAEAFGFADADEMLRAYAEDGVLVRGLADFRRWHRVWLNPESFARAGGSILTGLRAHMSSPNDAELGTAWAHVACGNSRAAATNLWMKGNAWKPPLRECLINAIRNLDHALENRHAE